MRLAAFLFGSFGVLSAGEDGAYATCAGGACSALAGEDGDTANHVGLVQLKVARQGIGRSAPAALQTRPLAADCKPYWAGKNNDTTRTGAAAYVAPSNLEEKPAWTWAVQSGSNLLRATPLIDCERNVYQSSISGDIHKFSPSGEVLWSQTFNGVPEVPALYEGGLYAISRDGYVFALDAATGDTQWSTRVCKNSGGDTHSVAASEGYIIAGACNSGVYGGNTDVVGLDAATGQLLWRFKPVEPVYNLLTSILDGKVVFSDQSGHLYVLDLKTGKEIFGRTSCHFFEDSSTTTGGTIVGPNGVAYVTAIVRDRRTREGQKQVPWHGRVAAFRLSNGNRIWDASPTCVTNTGAAVGRLGPDGKGPLSVVIGCGANPEMPRGPDHVAGINGTIKNTEVIAYDAETGKQRWTFQLPPWTGPAAGDTMENLCLPDSFSNPAIGGDGTVYIGAQNGILYAIREKAVLGDKQPQLIVSKYDTKRAFQASPALAPGMLAATSCDRLYVWRSK